MQKTATAFLQSLESKGIVLGLSRTKRFLKLFGNPQQSFASIHIAGSKGKGSTLFFVTEEPDGGPIVAQNAVEIAENETFDSLKEKVLAAEQEVILKAIKLFQADKLKVVGNKAMVVE